MRAFSLILLAWLLAACNVEATPAPDLQATIDTLNRQNTRQAASRPTPALPTPAKPALLTPTAIKVTPTGVKGMPGAEGLEVDLQGCTTSIDITHGLGEVTNAFIVIRNGGSAASNVCAELSATDEGKLHPDKLKCLPYLPESSQVALKLTVDTTYRESTVLKVTLTTDGGKKAVSSEMACKSLTVSAERALNLLLDLIRPLTK